MMEEKRRKSKTVQMIEEIKKNEKKFESLN